MNLKAVKKVNTGDQVYNQMRDQIMSSAWMSGGKIPSENQLMEVFGVSRGAIRQTIQKSSAVGLLETRRGEGSYVGQLGLANYFQGTVPAAFLDGDELEKVFGFKMPFGYRIAEMAAESTTDVQIRKLGKSYKKMLQNLGNLEKYIEIDFESHCLLGECTHNTLIYQIYKTTENTLTMSIREGTEMIEFKHGRKDHRLILKAVQSHDSQTAREAMRHHIIDHPTLALDVPAETEVGSLVKHI